MIGVDSTGKLCLSAPYDSTTGLQEAIIPASSASTTGPNGGITSLFGWRRRANDTAETGSTTTVINATSHSALIGDIVYFTTGNAAEAWSPVASKTTNTITLSYALPAAPANDDNFVIARPSPVGSIAASATGGLGPLSMAITRGDGYGVGSGAGAGFLLKNEDDPFSGGDALAMIGGRVSDSATTQSATDGDIVALALNRYGYVMVDVTTATSQTPANSIARAEDDAFTGGSAGVTLFAQRDDAASVDTSGSLDLGPVKMDKFNRLLVTEINQEHLFSCVSSSSIEDTNSTAVCAADADEIYVIKDICCSNSDTAIATRVTILDGATAIHDMVLGSMVAAAPGSSTVCQTFPTGIKAAAVNTAINAQATTTSAEVRCSIHGYKVPS